MCDTAVVVDEAGVLFGKNSDREALEAQPLERHPARSTRAGDEVRCTWVAIPDVPRTHEVLLSRPAWMWGAEMGVNDRGVAIGNEAVFTREPVAERGLTGMDLVRLGLERADSAGAALEVLIALLDRYPQGGRMGFGNTGFRYHSSFIVADAREAWVLETAGPYWAARRVHGHATLSNVLSIGTDWDRVHPEAAAHAVAQGWSPKGERLDFAAAFGKGFYRVATGGEVRQACTATGVAAAREPSDLAAVLQDHAGHQPGDGWRMVMPCAHASWLPTRQAGQSTASLVAWLGSRPEVWATGGPGPCLGVFKPVVFGRPVPGPAAGVEPDPDSLWWRQEALHREVLADYQPRRAAFEAERAALQARAWATDPADPQAVAALWEAHREALPGWTEAARAAGRPGHGPFARYWRGLGRKVDRGALPQVGGTLAPAPSSD